MKKPVGYVTLQRRRRNTLRDMGVGKDEEKTRIQFEKNTHNKTSLEYVFFC